MQDKETVTRFMESCGQFERIVNDSGLIRIIRLTDEEIIGTKNSAGIIEKYFSMSQEDTTCLQDLSLGAGEMKVGDNYLCLHTLSDPEDLPSNVSTDCRPERLPPVLCRTDRHPAHVQPYREPVPLHRRFGGDSQEVRADRPEHALAFPLQPFQPDQPRMD